jgi:hypothetical protein
MKLLKFLLIVSVIAVALWKSGNVQGNDSNLPRWVPKDLSFKVITPIIELNDNTIFSKESALFLPAGTQRFVDIAYSFGSITPHLYFNYDHIGNKNEFVVGNNNRKIVGASIDFKLRDFFYIVPVFGYYDWGDPSGNISNPETNKQWFGGLKFRFEF